MGALKHSVYLLNIRMLGSKVELFVGKEIVGHVIVCEAGIENALIEFARGIEQVEIVITGGL